MTDPRVLMQYHCGQRRSESWSRYPGRSAETSVGVNIGTDLLGPLGSIAPRKSPAGCVAHRRIWTCKWKSPQLSLNTKYCDLFAQKSSALGDFVPTCGEVRPLPWASLLDRHVARPRQFGGRLKILGGNSYWSPYSTNHQNHWQRHYTMKMGYKTMLRAKRS